MSEINKEILKNSIPDGEILSQTREFSKKHTENFITLFETLKNSAIDSKLDSLESRII